MRCACYGLEVGKLLQIRNLPELTHEELRRRAKDAGMTMSEFAGRILSEAMSTRSMEEIFAEVERDGIEIDVKQMLADLRAQRDASW
jgi:plasmid stability protein